MKTLETINVQPRGGLQPDAGSADFDLAGEPFARSAPNRDVFAKQSVGLIAFETGMVAPETGVHRLSPAKFVYGRSPHATGESIWFNASLEDVGYPGVTAASLATWPRLWQHPETSLALATIETLVTDVGRAALSDSDCWESLYRWVSPDCRTARDRFKQLALDWRRETESLSDTIEIIGHSAYQQIIGMGPFALPFIFHELNKEPEHWFHALVAITQADPVPEEEKGNLPVMRHRWIEWGAQNGYTERIGG